MLAQELRAEMVAIHDAHKILSDDLDEQVQFLAHLDQSVKSLQAKTTPEMHDAIVGSTNHATQVMASLRHDVDQLLAERSKTTNATADLDDRLAFMVDELRHELAEDMSTVRHNSTARDDVVRLIERLNRVQDKQSNDHLLLAEQVAQLESAVAQQVGTRIPQTQANDCSSDRTRRQSISVEVDTSSVQELRQEMGRQFELSAAALDEVSRRQSAVAEELASACSCMLSKEDADAIIRNLSAISDRVEGLEQIRDDNPSLSELSDKLNELVEKQWELDQSDTLQALEESVHTCIQEIAATASKLQSQSGAVAESIALSQDLSAISRRVDVLERGREGDLAQLFEKLNGVEEKSWDEQALLAEQIAALEAKMAVTPGGGGS
jgi:methionyl-tRNA synthetase